jgi:hypothetical protein
VLPLSLTNLGVALVPSEVVCGVCSGDRVLPGVPPACPLSARYSSFGVTSCAERIDRGSNADACRVTFSSLALES